MKATEQKPIIGGIVESATFSGRKDPRGLDARNKAYPPAFRDQLLRELDNSADYIVDVARRYGISPALLSKWVVKYRPDLAGSARIRAAIGNVPKRFTGVSLAEDDLTAILMVLAHPVRRAIVKRSRGGPMRQSDIQSEFELSGAAWSHHFTKLCQVGLLTFNGNGRNRFFLLNEEVLSQAISSFSELFQGPVLDEPE